MGKRFNFHDQCGWNNQVTGLQGFVKVGEEGSTSVATKSSNVSFLISCDEDGLVQALTKDGATNRFHMMAFFKTMHNLQKTRYNVPFDSNMHIMDNASVTRCKQFFDMVAKDKINIGYLSGYSPEL